MAPAPAQLDQAWIAVLDAVGRGLPGIGVTDRLVLGGRSAGARVACRTALRLGAIGVCALAFPLHPPGRPERTRSGELLAAAANHPVLVVQGRSDAFGTAAAVAALAVGEVVAVQGDHSLKADPAAVASAVTDWLRHRSAGSP